MKKKRRKKANNEWAEFQSQHELSDEVIQLARQTGYPLKRFQGLLVSDGPDHAATKSQRIRTLHQQWTEKLAKRKADIDAGLVEPRQKAKKTKYDPQWAKAKQVCRLNMDDIRKAKELGLGPQALIRNVPSPSQQWKAPSKSGFSKCTRNAFWHATSRKREPTRTE
ncbi:hypothetical protein [Stieleria varia]|nr:hypothetical protein [Stieleria varia]